MRYALRMGVGILGACWLASFAQADLAVQVYAYELPGEQVYYDQLAADFAASPGGVPVKITISTWDDAHAQTAEWLKAGKGPDLMVVPDIWLAEFAAGIEPFDAYLDKEVKADLYEILYKKGQYKGAFLGLPWATSTKALFFRSDLFVQAGLPPPITWAAQLGSAVTLHNPPAVYGIGLPGAREYETDDNLYFYFWSAGGRFFDENGKCAINTPPGIKALQFYCDLVNKYHVTQPEVTTWTRKEARRLFEAGRLAMLAEGPWTIEQLRKNDPDIKFAVVPLPVDQELVTQLITDHLVMPKYAPDKAAAARFVTFAYAKDRRLAFAKMGILPERMSVAQDPHFQDDPCWKVFVDVIPFGRTVPLIPWENIGKAVRETLYQTLSGRKPVKQALDDLAAEVDAIRAAQPAGESK